MEKQCSKCKVRKNISEFHKTKYQKDGYKTECKQCRKIYAKQKRVEKGGTNQVDRSIVNNNKTTGNYIQSFKSATEAGRLLNIDRKSITNNCVGKSKSSGGFIWSKIKKENIYE